MGEHKTSRRFTALPQNLIALALISITAIHPAYAGASSGQSSHTESIDWWHQPGFLGGWGGKRKTLAERGIVFFGNFETQTASIVNGGKQEHTATNYQIVLGTRLDLDKLMGIPDGQFVFSVSDRFGSNASQWAGTKVIINSNYGEGENFRLANLSFEQKLLKGRLDYQIGYFPSAAGFDYTPILCGFLNQGFCGHPNSLAADSSGVQNPPGAQPGAQVTGFIRPDVYLRAGVFEVIPSHYANNAPGFQLGTSGSTGRIYLTELGWNAKLGPQGLVGHYKIGGYYDTSKAPDVVDTGIQRKGRSNAWLAVDQMVYGIGPDARRGLVLFANLTRADKSNAPIESYYSAGFVFLGPFAGRPQDRLSLGWAKSNVNHRIVAAESAALPDVRYYGAEKYIDFSYRFQLTPWLFLTPDVQYLMNPGAFSKKHYPDATVIGGELAITF